jgi:hypothetical protein
VFTPSKGVPILHSTNARTRRLQLGGIRTTREMDGNRHFDFIGVREIPCIRDAKRIARENGEGSGVKVPAWRRKRKRGGRNQRHPIVENCRTLSACLVEFDPRLCLGSRETWPWNWNCNSNLTWWERVWRSDVGCYIVYPRLYDSPWQFEFKSILHSIFIFRRRIY